MYKVFAERKVGISAFKGTLKFEACGGFSNHRLELFILNNCLASSKQPASKQEWVDMQQWDTKGKNEEISPTEDALSLVTLPREELDAGSMANFLLHDKTRAN